MASRAAFSTRGAALQSCRGSSPQTGGNGRLAVSLTGLHLALIHPKRPREKLADIAMSWEEPSIPEELWKHLGFLFLCGRAASGAPPAGSLAARTGAALMLAEGF